MDKLVALFISIIKGWYKNVIFIGLGFFAAFAVFKLYILENTGLIEKDQTQTLMLFSFLTFMISYIVFFIFPSRFPCHNISWSSKMIQKLWRYGTDRSSILGTIVIVFLYSPLSILFKSVGLSLFLFAYFKPEYATIWNRLFANNDLEYKMLANFLVIPFAWAILGIGLPGYIFINFHKTHKTLSAFITLSWFIVFSAATSTLYLFDENITVKNLENSILELSAKFLMLMIGFIPLGWFYELFIGSIVSIEKKKKLPNI